MSLFTPSVLSAGLCFLAMAGGGGGRPYPEKIAVNRMGLQRIHAERSVQYKRLEFPSYEQWMASRQEKREKYGHTYAGVYHDGNIFLFEFAGRSYALLSKGKTLYLYEGDKVMKKIRLPRYMIWAEILPLTLGGRDYLVIYVNQQATSNTSTLLVVDKTLDVQYQEHLLGALALGHGSSARYGNYFVVEAGYEPDKKESLRERNVRWLYYLPAHGKTGDGR